MQIGPRAVATIEYTLKNDAGEVLDSSDGRAPLAYLHGVGNLVPGLEQALEGKGPGDVIEVVLPPEQGYGVRDERLIENMPVRKLPEKRAEVGTRYRVMTDRGPRYLLVTAVRGDYARVDANHPLAGVTLHFRVKVLEVREATEEELKHGHVHGPGGHQH